MLKRVRLPCLATMTGTEVSTWLFFSRSSMTSLVWPERFTSWNLICRELGMDMSDGGTGPSSSVVVWASSTTIEGKNMLFPPYLSVLVYCRVSTWTQIYCKATYFREALAKFDTRENTLPHSIVSPLEIAPRCFIDVCIMLETICIFLGLVPQVHGNTCI